MSFPASMLPRAILRADCPGNITWADPTSDILEAFNNMKFRSAVRVAENATGTYSLIISDGGNMTFSSLSTVTATQSSSHNIDSTNFDYLVGAAAVMTVGILAVIPTFCG
jgi:hypothetical protein